MTEPLVTRLKLPAFRKMINAQRWAIEETRGEQLLAYVEARATDGVLSMSAEEVQAGRERVAAGRQQATNAAGGRIAILPLYGVIAQRMDMMMAYCGGTSTERFGDDFDAAVADDNVSAIVIDCNSPGGSVTGTPELAKRIFSARGKKKIIAVSNGLMASAAYWICAAADEIICTPSGEVGSIGVFCVHLDESGMNEMLGLKYTIIKAGAHKAEGNSLEPLSAEAEAFMKGQVSEFNDMFIGAIAKYRGTDTKNVNAKFGQGRCLLASQAKQVGMIDGIATLEETLIRLGAKDVGMSGRGRRAFGQSGAVSDGSRTPPTAIVIRADDAPAETEPTTDGGDGDLCPACSEPMPDDGSNTCSSCGHVVADDDAVEGSDDGDGGADAAAAVATTDSREPVSLESTPVALDTLAAPGGAAHDAILQTERKRSNDIRALGAKHKLSGDQINAMLDEGISVEAAAVRVLSHVEARGTGATRIDVRGMVDREAERPFDTFGDQIVAVVQAGVPGRGRDKRLDYMNEQALRVAGAPSGMNESTGSEGGFYIQNDLLPGVIQPVYADDPILSRVNQIPIGADKNGIKFNLVDETSRVDGSRWGGIKVVWADEADTAQASKVKLRRVELELKKLIGFGYLTDELTQDAPAAQSLLVTAFQSELRFMLAQGIFRGKGGGQMLGIQNGGATVTQAIEATQTIANSPGFLYLNLPKMLMHMPVSLWGDAIWVYNPELLPYLIGSTLGATSIPLFVPYAGFGDAGAVDRILGRPAFASEQCEAVGTPGDIMLIAPSQYDMIQKGGAQAATSVHVRFLFDEMTLRITYRVDGQPRWISSVTPYKGAAARSPYVMLGTRA